MTEYVLYLILCMASMIMCIVMYILNLIVYHKITNKLREMKEELDRGRKMKDTLMIFISILLIPIYILIFIFWVIPNLLLDKILKRR